MSQGPCDVGHGPGMFRNDHKEHKSIFLNGSSLCGCGHVGKLARVPQERGWCRDGSRHAEGVVGISLTGIESKIVIFEFTTYFNLRRISSYSISFNRTFSSSYFMFFENC